MAKKDSLQTTPRLVKEVPKGYTEEIRDGKKVYVLKKETITPKQPTPVKPKATTSVKSGTPKRMPPSPKPVIPDASIQEDVVYLEDPKVTPVTQNIQRLRTDLKEDFPSGLQKGYHSYKVPDLTNGGNYTNAKSVITDSEGMPVVYDFKQGKYVQTGEPSIHSNMPVQNDTPTIQDPLKKNELPTVFDANPERLRTGKYNAPKVITPIVDTATYKGFNDVGTSNAINNAEFQIEQAKKLAVPKLKKGGIVGKIKGYYDGGEVDPYLSGNPNIPNQGQQFTNNGNANNFYSAFGSTNGVNSGVVNQTDTYGKARIDEENKTKKALGKVDWGGVAGSATGLAANLGANQQLKGIQKQRADAATINNTVDSALSTAMPIYGAGVAAKNTVSAMIPRDVNGNIKGGVENQIIDDTIKPLHTQVIEDITKGDAGAAIGDTLSAGMYSRTKNVLDYDKIQKARDENKKTSLEKYNALNKDYKTKQALAARDAGDFNATSNNLYDLKSAEYDDAGNLTDIKPTGYKKGGIVSKIQMCAKGGEIKGKGTGTSDSINAKVEEGSFVVPAKNAELAKGIRNLYLKVPSKKANINQKEGEEVKLSNGEHLFSPEENEYLESIGVDLESLAPNAEKEEDGMAEGGPVLSDKEVKQALENTKAKQLLLKEQLSKQVADYEKNPNKDPNQLPIINSIKEKIKKINTEFGDSKGYALPTAKVNKNSSKTYNELITPPLSWTGSKEAWKSAADKAIREGKVIPKDNVKVATNTSLKAPKIAQKVQAGKFTPSTASYDPKDDITVPGDNLSPLERAKLTASENKANADAAALNSSLPQTLPTESYSSQRKGSGILGKLGNIDPTAFLGAGQTALGYNMLREQVRPKDNAVIDPTYNASVNRSLQDATFGLTPEQKFAADQDIQNSLNDAKAVGLNYSGGSGVQAFNTNRAAINDAWKAKLGLSVADTDLRMQKQKYADAMAADRASILASNRRQAFNDAMGAFQQNQNAGSELIGAGLQNTIGAYRFNKIMNQQEQENAARNPYLNYNP